MTTTTTMVTHTASQDGDSKFDMKEMGAGAFGHQYDGENVEGEDNREFINETYWGEFDNSQNNVEGCENKNGWHPLSKATYKSLKGEGVLEQGKIVTIRTNKDTYEQKRSVSQTNFSQEE